MNTTTNNQETHPTKGFASMDKARQRELARMGGIRAHQLGTAHQWTPEEAQQAGRKGGSISRRSGPSKKKKALHTTQE